METVHATKSKKNLSKRKASMKASEHERAGHLQNQDRMGGIRRNFQKRIEKVPPCRLNCRHEIPVAFDFCFFACVAK